MRHLDEIEKAAQMAGFLTRRKNFRSLTVIQIREDKKWVLFDPINMDSDVVKILYAIYKREYGSDKSLHEMKMDMLKEISIEDNAVQEKR